MTKYKIGDRVKVVCQEHGHEFDIGSIVTIISFEKEDEDISYCAEDDKHEKWWLSESEIISAAEPAPEITLNGAVYILKPEPEHVWKFGDWARHPEYGVGFVCGKQDECYDVQMAFKNYSTEWVNTERLTYISTAEIPA